MHIGRFNIKLPKIFGEKKAKTNVEIGATGTQMFDGFISGEEYNSKLSGISGIEIYDQMRRSDASVKAVLSAITLPIRSANWFVEPASDDPMDKEVADFTSQALFEKMSITWDDFLRHALLCLVFGYMPFEKVFKKDEYEGREAIVWKKFAPRMPKTIQRWQTEDEKEGITQMLPDGKDVSIPIEKLIIFVNEKEGDNWEGISILRSAYRSWYIKDALYKIDAIAHERQGLGIPHITPPEGAGDEDKKKAIEYLENIRANEKAYAYTPPGWILEFLDMKANTARNPIESIKHHNRQIFVSVLADFLDLGGSETGSFALSKDKSSFFLLSTKALVKNVCDTINNYAIKELVDMNYDVKNYPKLKADNLANVDIKALTESVAKLVEKNLLVPDEKIEQFLRQQLDLPEKTEETISQTQQKQTQDVGKQKDENTTQEEIKQDVKKEQVKSSEVKKKSSFEMAEQNWRSWRGRTFAEKKLKLAYMEDKMDKYETELQTLLNEVYDKQKAELISSLQVALNYYRKGEAQKFRNAVKDIDLKYQGALKTIISGKAKEVYEFAKINAANTMKVESPQTPSVISAQNIAKIDVIVQGDSKDAISKAQNIFLDSIKNKKADKEIMDGVSQGLDTLFNNKSINMSGAVVMDSFNDGRDLVHNKNLDKIYGFQFSAILDYDTCQNCESLDGLIIDSRSKQYEDYKPPLHFNCRCIWVEIMNEEAEKPEITGIPESIPANEGLTNFKPLKKVIKK